MSTATIIYRPLDPTLAEPGALEELRHLRAERREAEQHRRDLAVAADRTARSARRRQGSSDCGSRAPRHHHRLLAA
jgi:hypothetical protein